MTDQPSGGRDSEAASPAARSSSQTLAHLRHELRTPLSHIVGYSEMLLEELADDTALCADLNEVRAAGQLLLDTITRILSTNDARPDWSAVELRLPLQMVLDRTERLVDQASTRGEPSVEQDLRRINSAARRLDALLESARAGAFVTVDVGVVSVTPAPTAPEPAAAVPRTDPPGGLILVVDDDDSNRDILSRRLKHQGHTVATAENGLRALELLRESPFDMVLLDIMMPELDGFEVLQRLKNDQVLRHLPVIMLSAHDDVGSVVRCIEGGADDYLPKPFNAVLLKARIGACLERKRLRDLEQALYSRLQEEQEKSERLLLNVLPQPISARLKQGETAIADSFPAVTVMFADLVNFTGMSAGVSPAELVELLQRVFSRFDALATRHGLEKIKTIGDSYMVVGGLPTPRPDHVEAIAEMALDILEAVGRIATIGGSPLKIRVGIHTGPVVAGIIGTQKFSYDLWGDTVNIARRMESHGQPGGIQISAETRARLGSRYRFEPRGTIELKGRGKMEAYLLLDRSGGRPDEPQASAPEDS